MLEIILSPGVKMVANNSKKGSKIRKIYNSILKRLPSTYPHAELIVHENLYELRKKYWWGNKASIDPTDDYEPLAFCDGNKNTIHVPLNLSKEPPKQMSWYILHEIGHLYALNKYGWKDKRWNGNLIAEDYANQFADRWLKRLKAERFYSKIRSV